jgi:nucleotide-binding universal stress UspA family protein
LNLGLEEADLKKLCVCIRPEAELVGVIKNELKQIDLGQYDEVHFVHGFQTQVYADMFYISSYPSEEQSQEIENSISDYLKMLSKETIPESSQTKIVHKCMFSNSPKVTVKEYVEQQKIDDMMIATRGDLGLKTLFSSSFAEYMVKFAPCRLIIVRSQHENR